MSRSPTEPRLVVVAGPPHDPIPVRGGGGLTIGRSSQCEGVLDDPYVSRRHLRLDKRGQAWFVTDLRSRHGTCLNGVRLEPEHAIPIQFGDFVSVGPWTLRFTAGEYPSASAPTLEDTGGHRVERIPGEELASLAQHRLSLLIDCAATIHSAADEATLAASVLEAAIAGTGFARAALLRAGGSGARVEVLGVRSSAPETGPLSFSRSLLREASTGQTARLIHDPTGVGTPSIIQLGIHAAMCAPVYVGSTIAGFLYLDSREGERDAHPDAPAFCAALARMAGLALANLRRADLEHRHRQLETDLLTARRAQEVLSPASEGRAGPIAWAVRSMPGRLVAGDLFDVFELDERTAAFFIGDVSGKGAGAAILMATAQAHLRGEMLHHADPARAVASLNQRLCARAGDGRFISLWVGVARLEPDSHGNRRAGTLTFVDAGHGHWLVRPPMGEASRPDSSRHLIVGVEPGQTYANTTIDVPVGTRVVLYSDGLLEQTDAAGERFGPEQVLEALSSSRDAAEDVARLLNAHGTFSGEVPLADDTTVASIEIAAASPLG